MMISKPVYQLAIHTIDLRRDLQRSQGDLAQAFALQAKYYDKAARVCLQMANAVTEEPQLKASFVNGHVQIDGPNDRIRSLLKDGVLEESSSLEGDNEDGG